MTPDAYAAPHCRHCRRTAHAGRIPRAACATMAVVIGRGMETVATLVGRRDRGDHPEA